ncbi:hypothetical protein SAMN04488020_11720 [Palleronia marisminoris]|uniref:Uncharacterized protein n=1 Tax=Palleronia marisminoris TaxID=315423 RepID=A0A1Y5TQB7_9RHOB|nr:hypothetical protein [Palleronia marisminoris]SFH48821.1 hypothetical protein SAMN04488020_11720 [Palleronia marisminoris]SLN69541.1 hypothetical protein PAM7066_03522 [Palleronia marisminoris]
MRRSAIIALSFCALAVPASAQVMDSYYATIAEADRHNSSGARLSSPGAVLQQDRANFHRFGTRQAGDQSDMFFANRELRAQIPALYARGQRDDWTDGVLSGAFGPGEAYLLVFVCGPRSQPTHINVEPADGDSERGC